jgi:hypothetical protein
MEITRDEKVKKTLLTVVCGQLLINVIDDFLPIFKTGTKKEKEIINQNQIFKKKAKSLVNQLREVLLVNLNVEYNSNIETEQLLNLSYLLEKLFFLNLDADALGEKEKEDFEKDLLVLLKKHKIKA